MQIVDDWRRQRRTAAVRAWSVAVFLFLSFWTVFYFTVVEWLW